jgi:hypothetical protein
MRLERSVLGFAALLIGCVGQAPAIEAPPRPAPAPLGIIGDLRITVLARRALQNDRALGPLNLGVQVRNGVAVVWGPVPSDEAARQVVAKLEALPGIDAVKVELTRRRAPDRPLLAELSLPERAPTRIQVAKPDEERLKPAPREAVVVAGEGKRLIRRGVVSSVPEEPRRGAVLLAPRAVCEERARPVVEPERAPAVPLLEAVERVRRSEARFRGISVEVRGAVVIVSRGGADDEDVTALAQALRRVRGVAAVMLAGE